MDKLNTTSINNRIRELVEELYFLGSCVPKYWLDVKYWDRLRWLKVNEDKLNG